VIVLKVTVLLALALACAMTAKRAAAATRHAMLVAAQVAVLALPLLGLVVPKIEMKSVETPVAMKRVAPRTATSMAVPRPLPTQPSRPDWLPLLWLGGTALLLTSRITSYLRAHAIVRRARPFGEALLSREVDQPVALGSRVVLPLAARDWDAERMTTVLLHERAHVARRDSLLGAIGDLACAVYWFHPLAWLVAARARLERERACDEAVLAQGVTACSYAAALLDVARERAFGMAMADRSQLATRIRAILDPSKRGRGTRAARAMVAVAAVVVAPILAALTTRAMEPDLRGDWIASPHSEWLPDVPLVRGTGFDVLEHAAAQPPRDEIDLVPARARWCLAQVRDGELVAPLIEKLSDDDWRVQAYAAWGLGVIGDRRATAPLLPLTEHSVWRLRAMAAAALANLADPAAADAMQRALHDEAWQVRYEAVQYFAALGGAEALLEPMKRDRHMAVRAIAQEVTR
jgi:beta-lactamase regulating signal transducer with metallopeptidase domain